MRGRLRLQATRGQRSLWAALNVLPLPGLGAIWAGTRNPHTLLLRHGGLQMALVVLGTYPLIVPGVVGFAWALWDAMQIAQAELLAKPPKAASSAVRAEAQQRF